MDQLFDAPSMGKKSVGVAHPICKDAYVLSRNSDLINSENYSELELHLEGRSKGSHEQARDYCKKDGNFKEFGIDEGGAGRCSDLKAVAAELREGKSMKAVALDHPALYVRNYRGLHQYLHMIHEPVGLLPLD